METQYDCSDIPDDRTELDIAKAIVRQWDNHDKFRVVAGEPNGEPDEVRVARALLRINHEYGCEVRDPWSRQRRLVEGIHVVLDGIEKEKALTPVKPGWRVVEMIRDILVDAIQMHQREIRKTIERDKNGVANS